MSGVTEETPLGLAAAARKVGDPRVTVTSLRAAIAEGRLQSTEDALLPGRKRVTVSAVRAMLAAEDAPKETAVADVEKPMENGPGKTPSTASKKRISVKK